MIKILKKYIKFFFWIISWIIVLSIIWLWIVWFIWWFPWKSYNLTEKYLKIWNYSIWKQDYYYNICDNREWCLNWEILWLKQNRNDIYIYIRINHWIWSVGLNKNKIDFFSYYLFNRNDYYKVNNINDLPEYWLIQDNNLSFYSENDLQNLPKEQKQIFKELEQNPKIIINRVDYTK